MGTLSHSLSGSLSRFLSSRLISFDRSLFSRLMVRTARRHLRRPEASAAIGYSSDSGIYLLRAEFYRVKHLVVSFIRVDEDERFAVLREIKISVKFLRLVFVVRISPDN